MAPKTLCARLAAAAAAGVLFASATGASAAVMYSGSLDASGINATGIWADQPSISWRITRNDDCTWHYEYTASVTRGDFSHFILEVSPTFTQDDLLNAEGPFGSALVGTYSPAQGNSNPNMPEAIWGIKFDATYGTTVLISFDTPRAPVWGDFYAKDGVAGGVTNTMWNKGFTSPDTDPMDPAGNGSVGNHILVPDTKVPEPASLTLLGLGALGLIGRRRRR